MLEKKDVHGGKVKSMYDCFPLSKLFDEYTIIHGSVVYIDLLQRI